MKRTIIAVLAGFALATVGLAQPANAVPPPLCGMPLGWYANQDEQAALPTPTEGGLKFEGKDLIHHATTGIDLADMDHVTGSFTATNAGKVVFKVETSAPYSTIITNPDGKLWSTAMSYDQDGGQGHPVAHYSDLVGKDTKPGKAHFDAASKVTTFGVGYWVEEGSTVVSEISFHGHTYDLTCKPLVAGVPKPKPTPTATHPTAPASSHPATSPPASSHPAMAGAAESLPLTGSNIWVLGTIGVAFLLAGVGAVFVAQRHRPRFTP